MKHFFPKLAAFFLILISFILSSHFIFAGTNIDLNTSTNYNIIVNGRDGSTQGGSPAAPMRTMEADMDNDGLNDLIITVLSSDTGTIYNTSPTPTPLTSYLRGAVYIVPGTVLRSHQGTGQAIDLTDSSNFWIRYVTEPFGQPEVPAIGDIDGDGKLDLVMSDSKASPWNSPIGHVYVILNAQMSTYTGIGNVVTLSSTPAAYKVTYTSPTSFESFGDQLKLGDIDNNGKDDLIITDSFYNQPATHNGTFFYIKDALINAMSGTGNVVSLNTATEFNIQYRLTGNSPNLSRGDIVIADVTGDNLKDIVVAALNDDPSGRDDAGSVFVLNNTLLNGIAGTGNVKDLATSSNYNIQFIGSTGDWLGSMADVGDIDKDGTGDIIIGAARADYNIPSTPTGSMFVVKGSSISGITGTGNTVDLSDTSKFWLRVDGPTAGSTFSGFATTGFLTDIDGNEKADIIVASRDSDNNGRNNSGSVYGFYDSILNSFTDPTGNTINLTDSSPIYTVRYDGPAASKGLGGGTALSTQRYGIGFSDLNNDGKSDLILGGTYFFSPFSFYVIYNFPHSLSLTDFPQNNIGAGFGFSGRVQAPNSTTNVSGLQFQLNSNDPMGSWTDCVASDGSFDSTDETFKCAVTGLSQQAYTVYVRAKDTLLSYTAKISYLSQGFNPFGPYVSSPEVGGSVPNPYQCSKEKPSGNVELFQISVTDKTATLYFTPANNNVSGYAIEYGYKNGDSRFAVEFDHSASSGVVSYTINELTPNTQYAFRVIPRNGCNAGEWTAWLAAKTVSKGQRAKQFYLYNKIK